MTSFTYTDNTSVWDTLDNQDFEALEQHALSTLHAEQNHYKQTSIQQQFPQNLHQHRTERQQTLQVNHKQDHIQQHPSLSSTNNSAISSASKSVSLPQSSRHSSTTPTLQSSSTRHLHRQQKRHRNTCIEEFLPRPSLDTILAQIREVNESSQSAKLIEDAKVVSQVEYPTNMGRREYQIQCVKSAIMHNTLIALPTGLGKTFISAVVMHNVSKWYPAGKIIFIAPTNPLLEQQLHACLSLVELPVERVVRLTGHVVASRRPQLWQNNTIFFCTAQTVQRDIASGVCPLSSVVLIVVDEAHNVNYTTHVHYLFLAYEYVVVVIVSHLKSITPIISCIQACGEHAMAVVVVIVSHLFSLTPIISCIQACGEHAMAVVVRKRSQIDRRFRVVALSATPGKSFIEVQSLVTTLCIEKIEAFARDDPQIAKYTNELRVEAVIVPQLQTSSKLLTMLERVAQYAITRIASSCTLPEWRHLNVMVLTSLMKHHSRDFNVLGYLGALVHLVQARKLLIGYSMKAFIDKIRCNFIETPRNKAKVSSARAAIRNSEHFVGMMTLAEDYVSRSLDTHPKLNKLVDILLDHFQNAPDSRVMIFAEFTSSVDEICAHLQTYSRRFRASRFVGKSTMSRHNQLSVVESFKHGEINVLVCTCIGEEGLDIGQVDLMIAFEAQSSPKRNVQRRGRTARQRNGRCIVLVMQGAEHAKYIKSRNHEITAFRALSAHGLQLAQYNFHLVPGHYVPQLKMMSLNPRAMPAPTSKLCKLRHPRKAIIRHVFLTHHQEKEFQHCFALRHNNTEHRPMFNLMSNADELHSPMYRLTSESTRCASLRYLMSSFQTTKMHPERCPKTKDNTRTKTAPRVDHVTSAKHSKLDEDIASHMPNNGDDDDNDDDDDDEKQWNDMDTILGEGLSSHLSTTITRANTSCARVNASHSHDNHSIAHQHCISSSTERQSIHTLSYQSLIHSSSKHTAHTAHPRISMNHIVSSSSPHAYDDDDDDDGVHHVDNTLDVKGCVTRRPPSSTMLLSIDECAPIVLRKVLHLVWKFHSYRTAYNNVVSSSSSSSSPTHTITSTIQFDAPPSLQHILNNDNYNTYQQYCKQPNHIDNNVINTNTQCDNLHVTIKPCASSSSSSSSTSQHTLPQLSSTQCNKITHDKVMTVMMKCKENGIVEASNHSDMSQRHNALMSNHSYQSPQHQSCYVDKIVSTTPSSTIRQLTQQVFTPDSSPLIRCRHKKRRAAPITPDISLSSSSSSSSSSLRCHDKSLLSQPVQCIKPTDCKRPSRRLRRAISTPLRNDVHCNNKNPSNKSIALAFSPVGVATQAAVRHCFVDAEAEHSDDECESNECDDEQSGSENNSIDDAFIDDTILSEQPDPSYYQRMMQSQSSSGI